MTKIYLGDSVYAEWDGHGIAPYGTAVDWVWLKIRNRLGAFHASCSLGGLLFASVHLPISGR